MKHLIKTMLSESLGTALSNEAVSFQHDRGLYLALVACFEPLVAKGRSKAVTAKDVRECGVVNVIKEGRIGDDEVDALGCEVSGGRVATGEVDGLWVCPECIEGTYL